MYIERLMPILQRHYNGRYGPVGGERTAFGTGSGPV